MSGRLPYAPGFDHLVYLRIFEGCNHSLEQKGDTLGALKNVRLIVECLDKMLV